ncbi:MAG TPA: DapH/DapD/GlmU-related protein [Chitinophagaceae bacterium]|uniref:DapH/DapD/GlmU-related protein n=1 Tax=Nitrosomonas sp. TaxID=42353 RepID=UPI002B3AFBA4|nr:DapH/DapD/GlmU-related protein [Nitrosomonas sp.]MEB2332132.1 DapH/DapD/GlmU-related protein [Nitrosomonas sp.]HRO71307.1 DapH/DapD/GlmU-related protein [Chitinophagaceae bacterium]
MRKITLFQVCSFMLLLSLALVFGIGTTILFFGNLPLGDFRGVFLVFSALVLIHGYAISIYRLFLKMYPLKEGEIEPGSSQEFIYHVYVLFYLMIFYPVMRSGFMPAPLMRIYYQTLGAQLGTNTYSQGIIHDPLFVQIGKNSTVGQSALLIPHVIEGSYLAHYPIGIGNNVTIGAHVVILAGVSIGDNAMVAAGAVVPKNSQIGPNEIWGGIPAHKLRIKQVGERNTLS